MNKLKVCFIGVGSIAKRHIKNLSLICREDGITLTVDALRMSPQLLPLPQEFAALLHKTYIDYTEMPKDYDIIFITNPTDFHIDALKRVHDKANHFFIEKPVTSYQKIEAIFQINYRSDSVYYVACPLRYTNVIQYLKENIHISDVLSVRCISSSYLPDWREGTDYRNTYSAHKDLGGGVRMDLIHEWDYIQYLFGKPDHIFYTFGKKSKLELDCEDYAVYIAEYRDKVVELHLDYFGRKPLREIMIFTKEDTVVGDLIHNRVSYLKQGNVIDFSEQRNDVQCKELRHFLTLLDSSKSDRNFILEAYQTLQYTQGVVK